MRVIRDRNIVSDPVTHLADDDAIPTEGAISVTLARFREELASLSTRSAKTGIRLDGDDNVREAADLIKAADFVAMEFPRYADGRCYSQARILRDQMGYTGELRAVGDVLRDQVFYLRRCGFDTLEIREDQRIEDALAALNDFTVTYQPAADVDQPLFRRS